MSREFQVAVWEFRGFHLSSVSMQMNKASENTVKSSTLLLVKKQEQAIRLRSLCYTDQEAVFLWMGYTINAIAGSYWLYITLLTSLKTNMRLSTASV